MGYLDNKQAVTGSLGSGDRAETGSPESDGRVETGSLGSGGRNEAWEPCCEQTSSVSRSWEAASSSSGASRT